MSLATQLLPGQFRKSPLALLLAVVIFLWLAYRLAQYVIAGDLFGLAYLGIGAVVLVSISTMLGRWRTGLFIFIGWLFFEDFARKYLGNNMAIYFAKDVLVAMVYLSFYLAYRQQKVKTFRLPFRLPLLLFFWFGVMQAFNPASTSIFFGIMGLKLYFYYIPLIFMGYALIDDESDLQKFFPYLLGLSMVVALLGIAQSILGHTFLNPTIIADDIRDLSTNYRVSPLTGVVVYRPTSVFVSNGRFAFFLVPVWLFAFGYGVYLILRSRKGRILTLLSLGSITVAIVMAVSRGTLLWTGGSALICVVAFLWGCPWQRGQLLRILRSFQRAILIGIVCLAIAAYLYPDEVKNRFTFYSESLSPSSPGNEVVNRTSTYPIQNFCMLSILPAGPMAMALAPHRLARNTSRASSVCHIRLFMWRVATALWSLNSASWVCFSGSSWRPLLRSLHGKRFANSKARSGSPSVSSFSGMPSCSYFLIPTQGSPLTKTSFSIAFCGFLSAFSFACQVSLLESRPTLSTLNHLPMQG